MEKDEMIQLVDKFDLHLDKKGADLNEKQDLVMLMKDKYKNEKLDFYLGEQEQEIEDELDDLDEDEQDKLDEEDEELEKQEEKEMKDEVIEPVIEDVPKKPVFKKPEKPKMEIPANKPPLINRPTINVDR